MFKKFLALSKEQKIRTIMNFLLVILGNLVLAMGVKLFQETHELVSGGVTGIAIIVQHFTGTEPIFAGIPFLGDITTVTLVSTALTIILWIIGFVFIGKEFAFKTLLSSIVFPIFMVMFDSIPMMGDIALDIAYAGGVETATPDVGRILLSGIFGGVSVGAGCALAFLGGGSTGGVDIIAFILEKYLKIKTSIAVFIIDGTIVLLGFIFLQDPIATMCGIITAFLCSTMVEVIYSSNQSCYVADIVSEKWEEIRDYIYATINRGSTIIEAKGGYRGKPRIILRIVFDKAQFYKVKQGIAEIDPHAFITYTQTNAVFGEGFTYNKNKKKDK